MQQLEALYLHELKRAEFNERKHRIQEGKHIIVAPSGSGITSLVYDFLLTYDKAHYLYIDFKDPRVDIQNIQSSLQRFIDKHAIRILVIEAYEDTFALPTIETCILTTHGNLTLEGFKTAYLYPLDFEEFVSFGQAQASIEHMFSLFLQTGTYPKVIQHHKNTQIQTYQTLIKNSFDNPLLYQLFITLSSHMGLKVSVYQLFLEYKKTHKISKDFFYASIKKLEQMQMIFLLGKHNTTQGVKKIYFIDHAFYHYFSFDKGLPRVFENMIFLELYKRKNIVFHDTYYSFIEPLTQTAYISAPFAQTQQALKKVEQAYKHKEFIPKKVIFITTSLEGTYEKNAILIEIIPFYMWALSL